MKYLPHNLSDIISQSLFVLAIPFRSAQLLQPSSIQRDTPLLQLGRDDCKDPKYHPYEEKKENHCRLCSMCILHMEK
ncbi:unnamed protein product [Cuscuta campestris]|uniref:Uncharacterized protein n=1 Tax=Cuscuta campestris TaxID=132261 RepID=A0A484NEU9_9ASTE|nr:unnamed protein product [Cuscuta campestris]